MRAGTKRLAKMLSRFVYYADGKLHWRRISLTALAPLAIWLVAAFKPELLAAHLYGTAKTGLELLELAIALFVGRDVQKSEEIVPGADREDPS